MKKAINTILWIVFLISFVPYLYLVKAAFFGADVGLFNPWWAYGFKAVYTLICYLTIVPIFPVCLIYELIYGIVMFRKFGRTRRLITIFLPITLIALIVLPCTVYEINDRYQNTKYYENNSEKVWAYLRENYSDEILETAELTLRNREDGQFWLFLNKTVFNEISYIEIILNEDGSILDDFGEYFKNSSNQQFINDFGEYLDSYYGLDGNTDLQALVYGIDMSDYSFQDSLDDVFGRCEYVITSVYFTEETYDKDSTIKLIEEFYTKTMPIIPVQDEESFNFYVMQDGRFHASIHAYDKNADGKDVMLFFKGYHYTNEEGPTIQSEDIVINL